MTEKNAAPVPEVDDEDDFELISSVRQLAPPPALNKEKVKLPEWPTTTGKGAIFLAWELSGSDYSKFLDSGWVYKDGVRHHYDPVNEDLRWLMFTLRDAHGNQLWQSVDALESSELGRLGRATQLKLIAAANRMNDGNTARAEGNSEKTQTAA